MAHAELSELMAGEVEASPHRRSLAGSLESWLGMLVEIPAAILVVAEVVILFAGVVARYGLRQPLIWSDELASILFLWLAMLGAAVAFRRSEHMRMTAIVANAKPSMRAYLDVVATCAALGFLVLIAWPSYEYAYEESFITTPALQIPNIWRAAALPAGICLMALFALLRLARSGDARLVLGAVLSVALLIEMTGMARAMVAFLASLLGHVKGGLHYVLVGAMYLVSGISGSKAADMAAVAPVLFPEMKARGARPGDLVALLAATGAQTETIPPSLVLITIGSVTGVSIAALFTGGLLPGVVLAITLSALVWWRYRGEDLRHVTRASGAEIVRAFFIALPAIALPFVIRYAVVEGIATATEVSTIGIVYSFIIGLLIYRRFDWRRLLPMLIETAALSGAILLIIGTATGMAWGLTQSGFSRALAGAMTGLPGGSASFIAVSIVAFTILGSVLEGIPAIVLFGPLLFPIARAVGVHEVHYAVVIILAIGIGLLAPPFGLGCYYTCAIGPLDPAEGIRPIWGYLLALLVGLIIVAVFPWISIGFL